MLRTVVSRSKAGKTSNYMRVQPGLCCAAHLATSALLIAVPAGAGLCVRHSWSGHWDKEAALHLAPSERHRDRAADHGGEEGRAAVANLGSGRPQFRPSSPSSAALALVTLPSLSQARSPGHRGGDPRAPDTAVASRSKNNGRAGSKRSATSGPPLQDPGSLHREGWAGAPPQPESWLHLGAGTTHSDGGGGGAGVSTEALVGSRVLSLATLTHTRFAPLSSTEPGLTSKKCVLHRDCSGKVFKQGKNLLSLGFVIYTEGFGGKEI